MRASNDATPKPEGRVGRPATGDAIEGTPHAFAEEAVAEPKGRLGMNGSGQSDRICDHIWDRLARAEDAGVAFSPRHIR